GCLIHACTHLESAIAIDLVNKTIHLAIFRQVEKTRYFNEDGKQTPEVIRDWANHLSQLNKPTNNSESQSAFAARGALVARTENSHLRRLRGAAPVRGFIG